VGTFGDARGTVGACRADLVMLARFVVGVFAPVAPPVGKSTSDESGVVGRDVCVLNEGRSRDVKDGDGGSGVGGLL
jgi:hypothetical protein